MTGWNLPPGVNVSDLPGNSPSESRWEEFNDWAMKELGSLSLQEAYWAVKMGIAAIQAQQKDLNEYIKDLQAEAFQTGREQGLDDNL